MTNQPKPMPNARAEAKACGLVRYFTGKACKHGHVAERFASTGQCSACVAENKQKHPPTSERAREGAARRNKRWGGKVKARKAAAGREWRQKNTERVRAYVLNRRALRAAATPPWFGELDELVALEATELAERREQATGAAWHVDHMVPLRAKTACGLHVGVNLQVIPAAMNIAKGNKLRLTEPGEWLRAI